MVKIKKKVSVKDFFILGTVSIALSAYLWWIPTLQNVELERRRRRQEQEKKLREQGLDPDKELGEFNPPPSWLFIRPFPTEEEKKTK